MTSIPPADTDVESDSSSAANEAAFGRERTWLTRDRLIAVAAGAVAVLAVVAWITSTVSFRAQLEDTEVRLAATIEARDASFARYQDLRGELVRTQNEAEQQVADLEEREAAIGAREAAATAAQQRLQDNQITNGIWRVGQDVPAGTYRSVNNDGCYHAFLAGIGPDADIIDNDNTDGPVVVQLSDGDVFESSRCNAWNRE